MCRKTEKGSLADRKELTMSVAANLDRPCPISESIMQSCKEVKNMREGRTPKRSLNDLFANIEKWSKEEEK